jgi:hypothetical protein
MVGFFSNPDIPIREHILFRVISKPGLWPSSFITWE